MDGKAFSWQFHYIQTPDFQCKTFQILQDVGNRFDDGPFEDLVAELTRLK